MNVAILGIKSFPAYAGADRVVEKIVENSDPSRVRFFIYVMKGKGETLSTVPEHVELISIPSVGGKYLRPWVYFMLSAGHCLFHRRIHIAHIHNSDFGLFCLLLRLRQSLSLIGTFHGNPYLREKWGHLAKLYLRFSEFFFVRCCHQLTTVARSKLQEVGQAFRRKVVYIPNGADPYWEMSLEEEFDCSQYGLEPRKYILFACGRLDSTKGLHHLLRAYRLGRHGGKILIIGDFSHDASYTASILDEYGDDDHIVFIRHLLSRDMLIDAIRNCQVFVFPSEVEAMSMMLLEAISCRIPVICSDIVENIEIVGRDYTYLFRSESAEDLSDKLDALLSDPKCREGATKLYDSCMNRFSWPALASSYMDLYERQSS